MRSHVLSFSSVLVMSLVVSCKTTKDNPNHCQNNNGNDWCADKHPDGSLPYCAIGACPGIDAVDGCVAERPEDDACYSPCGDDQTFEDDPSCDGVADSGTEATTQTSSSMSDTAPTATTDDPTLTTSMSMSESESETETDPTSETESTTGPTGCVSSDECTDPAAPICENLVCVPCTDATDPDDACEMKDASAPACRDDGQCVQCTGTNASACDGETPVCGDASSCVGCTYHEQCPESACQIDTGACFDDTCVVTVDGDGPAQYESIAEGITNGCVVIVHELADEAPYLEALSINGMSVALLAADGELPRVQGTGGDPSLAVSGGADVYVQGLMFTDADVEGVSVDGASAWLDRTRVVGNDGGGILVTGNGSAANLRNCAVAGSATQDAAAVQVNDGSLDALYTTMVGYDDGAGGGAALRCNSPGEVLVRNSIMVKTFAGAEVLCEDADVTYSASDVEITGTGNVGLGNMVPAWFTADLHLAAIPKAVNTAAQWNTGDPLVDIDGEERPSVPGTPDVAGADVP